MKLIGVSKSSLRKTTSCERQPRGRNPEGGTGNYRDVGLKSGGGSTSARLKGQEDREDLHPVRLIP